MHCVRRWKVQTWSFIAAGMGGGTGTGAAPVVAEVAKDLGILTVAVVTKPFNFEGKKRMAFAEQGITELSKHVDSLITIPNDKLLKVLGRGISLLDAFGAAKRRTQRRCARYRRTDYSSGFDERGLCRRTHRNV
ncbi:cell division protein FtsZ [Escherichia coli]|uniref:Cell division protein FtsZ n=1 Tax=Escherichia coli TaxID=562 RepID=A0A376MQU8_ECOLX|nr:cell division protein FtsZ [Escherichia coli]